MTRRTPTDTPTTETPALHGHYDGPRGFDDEHRHPDGGKPHPHNGRDGHLGRPAEVVEYVHPGHLDGERRAFKALQRLQALQDRPATGSVTSADTPTSELSALAGAFTPATELVKATTTGNGHRPQKYADLVRIAEKVDALRADVQRTIDLETELDAAADLLAAARAQEADSEPVDPSILHQLEEHHDRYAIRLQDWIGQRGLRKIERAGS